MVVASGILRNEGYAPTDSSVIEARQAMLDLANASLAAAVRERYPIVTMDEIEARYPDQWIAIIPTHVNDQDSLAAGRLIAHGADHRSFAEQVGKFGQAFPDVHLYTDFTGRYPMGEQTFYA